MFFLFNMIVLPTPPLLLRPLQTALLLLVNTESAATAAVVSFGALADDAGAVEDAADGVRLPLVALYNSLEVIGALGLEEALQNAVVDGLVLAAAVYHIRVRRLRLECETWRHVDNVILVFYYNSRQPFQNILVVGSGLEDLFGYKHEFNKGLNERRIELEHQGAVALVVALLNQTGYLINLASPCLLGSLLELLAGHAHKFLNVTVLIRHFYLRTELQLYERPERLQALVEFLLGAIYPPLLQSLGLTAAALHRKKPVYCFVSVEQRVHGLQVGRTESQLLGGCSAGRVVRH